MAILLTHGARLTDSDRNGMTALMYAAETSSGSQEDRLRTVELLLGAGADIDAKDKQGETALMKASKKKNMPVIDVLLSAANASKA